MCRRLLECVSRNVGSSRTPFAASQPEMPQCSWRLQLVPQVCARVSVEKIIGTRKCDDYLHFQLIQKAEYFAPAHFGNVSNSLRLLQSFRRKSRDDGVSDDTVLSSMFLFRVFCEHL